MNISVWLLLIVFLIVLMTVRWKVHPFLALLFGAISTGLVTGMPAVTVIEVLAGGFGATLRSIGIIIACGAIIGEYLHRSGGARVLAGAILNFTGEKYAPLSMSITGYVVSIPVFCDSGFIVLSALKKAISKRTGISLAIMTVALASGLYATHVFVPPTPGPIAAAATLDAQVGWVLLAGLLVSVPVVSVALLWAVMGCKHVKVEYDYREVPVPENNVAPSFLWAIMPIILPIFLIGLKSVAEYPTEPFGSGILYSILIFSGDPIMALLLGVVLAFGMVRGGKKRVQYEWMEEALKKAGVILLITGSGGAFGSVLRETNLGEVAMQFAVMGSLGLLIPFFVSAFIKTAQGSSTVAIITAAVIMVPLLEPLGLDCSTGKVLTVLALGSGSMTVSHVNDSYFWVVAKFSGMDTATALKTHTVATLIMGITGLITLQVIAWVML